MLVLFSASISLSILGLLGCTYWTHTGVAEMSSFFDAFFFSVETLATVGYRHMYPETFPCAPDLPYSTLMVGMFGLAVVTGLIFVHHCVTALADSTVKTQRLSSVVRLPRSPRVNSHEIIRR